MVVAKVVEVKIVVLLVKVSFDGIWKLGVIYSPGLHRLRWRECEGKEEARRSRSQCWESRSTFNELKLGRGLRTLSV